MSIFPMEVAHVLISRWLKRTVTANSVRVINLNFWIRKIRSHEEILLSRKLRTRCIPQMRHGRYDLNGIAPINISRITLSECDGCRVFISRRYGVLPILSLLIG